MGPYCFNIMRDPNSVNAIDPLTFNKQLTNEDICEYIEGVGSNSALVMVSRLSDISQTIKIEGIDILIETIEGHYMYY